MKIYGVLSSITLLIDSSYCCLNLQALKQLPREKIQLATKFGIVPLGGLEFAVNGTPEYVRKCCEASLERLQVDYIDLYYQHRIDANRRNCKSSFRKKVKRYHKVTKVDILLGNEVNYSPISFFVSLLPPMFCSLMTVSSLPFEPLVGWCEDGRAKEAGGRGKDKVHRVVWSKCKHN